MSQESDAPSAEAGALDALSDTTLLRRYRLGSQRAAERLYERYAARLRALARANLSVGLAQRLDIEDIVQSVFRRFFRAVDQGNYTLPSGEDLWALLMVIALNRIRVEESYHRAARRDVRRTVPLAAEPTRPGGARAADATGLLQVIVHDALDRLPPPYRRVVELRVEGYDVAEIAQLTSRSKRTVERLLQNARTQLKTLLIGGEDDGGADVADGR